MAMTMRLFLTRTYDDDNDNDNDSDKRPRFFRQQPTLVGCIPGRGVVGVFYDDDKDEDDNNGNYNEEDHCPCLFQKVLPMQSMAMLTVRTTTTTSFYDATTNLMVRCIPGREGGMTMITMTNSRTMTMMTAMMTVT